LKKLKILHVAAHHGGGVGSTIRAWISGDVFNTHTLTYLNDIPENKNKYTELFNIDMIKDYDFVICHVWNHPAMMEFLMTVRLPPCRLIGWSHMAGNHAPYVLFDKLINHFDEFLYTSPVSNLCGTEKDFIWSTCNIDDFLCMKNKKHEGFNIGYIGTLDYCKLHPDFIDICESISIPGSKFVIVGDGCDAKAIKEEIKTRNLEDRFIFTGIVEDVKPFLSLFDVFLYPLYEKHFGTCEQVLGEALASGIPCIVLNNDAESIIIEDMKNGTICNDIEEIPGKIHDIYMKKIKLDRTTIRKSAYERYSVRDKITKWNEVFDKAITENKKEHVWEKIKEVEDIFIESLGEDGKIFKLYVRFSKKGDYYGLSTFAIPRIKQLFKNNRQWHSKNKGSITQYANYFSENEYLQKWKELL